MFVVNNCRRSDSESQTVEPWLPNVVVGGHLRFTGLFLPARRYASAGYSDRNVSVRLSVTRRYCVKTKKAMISSPSGSPKTLVF